MDHDWILNCIKAGAKYVFVSKGKLYDVQDQDFNDLENTDHTVRLTGGLDSDGRSITVTQIETATGTTK